MTTPEYTPNTPPNQSSFIGRTQPLMLENFQSLYNAFLVNHIALDDATVGNRGSHTILQMPGQAGNLQTDLGELSLYCRKVPNDPSVESKNFQLFMQYQQNQAEFQYTNYQIYALSNNNPTQFFTFLPGNILVYFGLVNLTFDQFSQKAELNLLPAVCKNITMINLCASNTTGQRTPWTNLVAPGENGIYKTIIVNAIFTGNPPPTQFFYMVMGNL